MLIRLRVLTLAIGLTNAFKDTSPFFLFSTSELLTSSPNLVSADHLRKTIIPQLTKCISDTYVIVSQPGVEAADFEDGYSAPWLQHLMAGGDKSIRSSFSVTDVLGEVNVDDLSRIIQDRCEAGHLRIDASTGSFAITEDTKPRVINVDFPALPSGAERPQRLLEHGAFTSVALRKGFMLMPSDAFLASMLDVIASKKYTVVYTTSPPNAAPHTESGDSEVYEMDSHFQSHLHTDLKRDLSHQKRAFDENITLPDGPLFEKYQYFSPGLFMGILVFFILISILYVGINGVASLQVSYAAFDKEMGPSAQKPKSQ